ncbi:MAG TPA: anaerobic ribonucleoside-triphosphate reductase activating protein, partial [Euryarchaeota archaeon]|nr:anaerobic ribonucleoside-triphosphate reductase activating protein [Euryarchaeota archaeon]
MQIKGVVETSFVDWDGKIVSTIFLPGCNFRCGFCHNHKLVL